MQWVFSSSRPVPDPIPLVVEPLEARRLMSVTYHIELTTPDGKGLDRTVTPEYYLTPNTTDSAYQIDQGSTDEALAIIEHEIYGGEQASDPYPATTSHWDSYASVGTDYQHLFNIENLTYDPLTFCYSAQIGHQAYAEGTQLPVKGQYYNIWSVRLVADAQWNFNDQGFYVDPKDEASLHEALSDFSVPWEIKNDQGQMVDNPAYNAGKHSAAVVTIGTLMEQPPLRDEAFVTLDGEYKSLPLDYQIQIDNWHAFHPPCPVFINIGWGGDVQAFVPDGVIKGSGGASASISDGYCFDADGVAVAWAHPAAGGLMSGTLMGGDDDTGQLVNAQLDGMQETQSGILECHATWTDQNGDHTAWIRKSFSDSCWYNP